MDLKKEIQILLDTLKNSGYSRSVIEKEIGYKQSSITTMLSRGGNEKLKMNLMKFIEAHPPENNDNDLVNKNSGVFKKNSIDRYRDKYEAMLEAENQRLKKDWINLTEQVAELRSNLNEVRNFQKHSHTSHSAHLQVVLMALARLLPKSPAQKLKFEPKDEWLFDFVDKLIAGNQSEVPGSGIGARKIDIGSRG